MIAKTPYFDAVEEANCFIGEVATSNQGGGFRSGGAAFGSAIIVRASPLVMISTNGDMLWTQKTREDIGIGYAQENESLAFRKGLALRQSDFPKINGDKEYKPLMLADYFSEPTKNNWDLYSDYSIRASEEFMRVYLFIEPDVNIRRNAASLLVRHFLLYRTPYHRNWLLVDADTQDAYLTQEGRRWIMPVEFDEAMKAISLARSEADVMVATGQG